MTTLASAIAESGAWAALTVLALAITNSACGPVLDRRREEAVRASLAHEAAQLFAEALGLRGPRAQPTAEPAAEHAGADATGAHAAHAPLASSPHVGGTASPPSHPRVPSRDLSGSPGDQARVLGGASARTDAAAPVRVHGRVVA